MKVKNLSQNTLTLQLKEGEIKFAPNDIIDMPKALYNCLLDTIKMEVVEEEIKVASEPAPIVKETKNEKSKKLRK